MTGGPVSKVTGGLGHDMCLLDGDVSGFLVTTRSFTLENSMLPTCPHSGAEFSWWYPSWDENILFTNILGYEMKDIYTHFIGFCHNIKVSQEENKK